MSKRQMILNEIARIASELPDEELRRLERFAAYLKDIQKERTNDPLMDLVFGTFRQFAESKGAVLYAILFREAGIGLQWFEEKRAGEKPSPEWREAKPGELLTMTYRDELLLWQRRGLVLYKYYPTLSEALAGEWRRLDEIE